MKVQFVYPKSDHLKKHIEFFSFLQTSGEAEVHLLLFPNVVTIMSLSPNTALEIENNSVTVKIDPKVSGIQSDITGRLLAPLYFRYFGACNEICIVFKPLGLEYFFSQSFYEIAPNNYQSFKPVFDDWADFAEQLFALTDQDDQVEALENYFLQKIGSPRLEIFQKVVDHLLNIEENLSISEICFRTGLHQKQVERLCKKHLGCTAATFRRIARFRHSISLQLTEAASLDLTATSHESHFFDQAHFGKEFRRLSDMSPKEFFHSTWKLPQYSIVWKLK